MSVRVSAGSSPWESSKQPGLGIRRGDMPFASTQKPSPVLEHSGEGLSCKSSKPSMLKVFLTVAARLRCAFSAWLLWFDFLFFFSEINGQVITYSSLFFQMPFVILWGNTRVTHGWPGVSRVSGHAWEISGCFTSVEEVARVALEREGKKRNWVWMVAKQMPCYSGIQYIEEVVWFLSN